MLGLDPFCSDFEKRNFEGPNAPVGLQSSYVIGEILREPLLSSERQLTSLSYLLCFDRSPTCVGVGLGLFFFFLRTSPFFFGCLFVFLCYYVPLSVCVSVRKQIVAPPVSTLPFPPLFPKGSEWRSYSPPFSAHRAPYHLFFSG